MKNKLKTFIVIFSLFVVVLFAVGVGFYPVQVTALPDNGSEKVVYKTNLINDKFNPVHLKTPVKENYIFNGWKDISTKKGLLTARTYKATWVGVPYTISYVDNGIETRSIPARYGDITPIDNNNAFVSKHPYENFVGWKDEKGNIVKEKELPADTNHDIKLTASYVGKTYKVAYNLDNGSANNPSSYQYGKGINTLSNAVKSGYTFDGWFSDVNKTQKITNISKTAHGDLTIYAKFHENPKPVVRQQPQHNSVSQRSYISTQPANNGGSPSFPYVGNAGSLTLSNGYSVALQFGYEQYNIDPPYMAAYETNMGNAFKLNPDGSITDDIVDPFTIVADHNYGKPAALPGTLNSNTMWIKHPNGSVETLHKVATIRTNAQLTDSNGNNYFDGTVVHKYGRLLFQTCDESGTGRVLTIWN